VGRIFQRVCLFIYVWKTRIWYGLWLSSSVLSLQIYPVRRDAPSWFNDEETNETIWTASASQRKIQQQSKEKRTWCLLFWINQIDWKVHFSDLSTCDPCYEYISLDVGYWAWIFIIGKNELLCVNLYSIRYGERCCSWLLLNSNHIFMENG
jgi:hypothetical protein